VPVSLLGVAAVPEGLGLVAATAAASVALVSYDPRRRAWAMLAALVLAGGALVPQVHSKVTERPAFAAAGAVAGLVVVVVLAWLFVRRPAALGLLALAALPFRVPVSVGADTASLLVPLYGVIAGGAVAYAVTRLRPREEPDPEVRDRRVSYVVWALAAVMVLYALQSLYSQDVDTAAKNVCFFYVPFAVLFRLLVELPWTRRLLRASLGVVTGLAVLFAAVGVVEYATGRLLLVNEKVLSANELEPYFRVNSLFFDPSVYGRYEALAIVVLAAVLLWSRRPRDGWLIAATCALLWLGMVFSLSQSSFAALLAGLAVLTALRWRIRWAVLALGVAAVASAAVVALAPDAVGLKSDSTSALDKATSGRASLVRGAARMARDRPVWGEGAGSFAVVFKARERVPNPERAAVSHTIPLTVAAEQGAIGLIAYVALLWAAAVLLFRGLRVALRRHPDAPTVARAAVAAAFVALWVHTLVYAAYLEDPLAWALLALGAALLPGPGRPPEAEPEPRERAVTAPTLASAKPF
jgi:O-antigen ligase